MVPRTLYYGVAGEGRGHAARALALIEQLHERHRVVVYSYGQALSLLKAACRTLNVEVRTLPPLEFSHTSRRTLSYTRTFFTNVGYLKDLSDIFLRVQRDMERTPPDLIISDFEPVLPRGQGEVPRMLVGVEVVIARHERDSIGFDLRRFQNLGERLELTWKAVLGHVAGHHEVLGARVHGLTHRSKQTVSAVLRVFDTPEAEEVHPKAMSPRPAMMVGLEQVRIGDVSHPHAAILASTARQPGDIEITLP